METEAFVDAARLAADDFALWVDVVEVCMNFNVVVVAVFQYILC